MSACEVVPNLFVGDWNDAMVFQGECLCVLESALHYNNKTYQVNILQAVDGAVSARPLTKSGLSFYASRKQLRRAAEIINDCQARGVKLLVHCAAGVERSPLTCAWWLVASGRHSSLDAAYTHLKAVRPVVQDRQMWLESAA